MYVVDQDDGVACGRPPAPRFSPLRMVARALGVLNTPQDEARFRETDQLVVELAPTVPRFSMTADAPFEAAPPEPVVVATPEIEIGARASGESILAIVDALLAQEGEGAWLAAEDAEFDLSAMVAAAADAFAPDAEGKGVVLAIQTSPAVGEVCVGDALRLRQTLLNLVSGGLKATSQGPVVIDVDWAADRLSLRVGCAGAARAMSRVVTGAAGPVLRGAGARLAMARRVALSMGGAVGINGEVIEVSLPLRRAAGVVATPPAMQVEAEERPLWAAGSFRPLPVYESQPQEAFEEIIEDAPPSEPAAAPTLAGPTGPELEPGLRVLVGDESGAHRQVLRTLLEGMGCEVVTVADSQQLVAAWREENWDAVLIDIEGAAMSGRALARSIRAAETVARWPRTPMVALASSVKMRDLDEDFAELIDGLVAKPIQASSLQAAIETALGAAEAGHSLSTQGMGFRMRA